MVIADLACSLRHHILQMALGQMASDIMFRGWTFAVRKELRARAKSIWRTGAYGLKAKARATWAK